MYSLILFFSSLVVGVAQPCALGYRGIKDRVLQGRVHWSGHGISSMGRFLISDVYNSKVATCFAGRSVVNNPVSILDLNTSIDKPFEVIPILNNNTPVSAVSLVDDNMIAVAHSKNVYIFAEPAAVVVEGFNNILSSVFSKISYVFRHFFDSDDPDSSLLGLFGGKLPKPLLQQISELHPELAENDDQVSVIKSSLSHIITVSKKGLISSWPRKGREVIDTAKKTIRCQEPFFSTAFHQQHNILCVGLSNGRVWMIDAASLEAKVIPVFDRNFLNINCMNFAGNRLLCAALCDCYTPYCCRGGYEEHLNDLVEKKRLGPCNTCNNNRVNNLCEHRIRNIDNFPAYCNCHTEEKDVRQIFYLCKRAGWCQDVLKIIIGIIIRLCGENKQAQCNNMYTILSLKYLRGNSAQVKPVVNVTDKFDMCCKKIALLPNGKCVIHAHLCTENRKRTGHIDRDIREYVIVASCNDDMTPQQRIGVVNTDKGTAIYDEYPVHVKEDEDAVCMLGEMNYMGYQNQQIAFNTWYKTGGSSFKEFCSCLFKRDIASQSYFSYTLTRILPVVVVGMLACWLIKCFRES